MEVRVDTESQILFCTLEGPYTLEKSNDLKFLPINQHSETVTFTLRNKNNIVTAVSKLHIKALFNKLNYQMLNTEYNMKISFYEDHDQLDNSMS